MKYLTRIITILLLSINTVIPTDDQQNLVLPKNIVLNVFKKEEFLSYDQLNNTYTLTLDDSRLDAPYLYKIVGTYQGNNIVNVESNKDKIEITCLNSSNFIITNKSYIAIGTSTKDLIISCQGNLGISNEVRANIISMAANSINFQDEISVQKTLFLKTRNLQFLTPFLGSSTINMDENGFILFLGSPIRPSRMSWENLCIVKHNLAQEYFYKEIIKLAGVNSIPDISESYLHSIFDQCKNKDLLADALVMKFFQDNGFTSINTKMFERDGKGNGFDGLFIKGDERILVEVKFDNRKNTKTPKPGQLNISGTNRRQLSTPYNKKILKDMMSHNDLKEAYNLIEQHQNSILLYFIVLNARNLTLDIYNAGIFSKSKLD